MEFLNSQKGARVANSAANAAVADRMDFLKKVYGLLTVSLLSTTVAAFYGQALDPAVSFWPLLIAFFGTLIFAMAVRRKPVWNLIALFSFTTVGGLFIAPVMLMYNAAVVQEALVLTLVIFGSLTMYVVMSKRDFSFLRGFLITGLVVVIAGSLLNAFLFQSPMGEFAIAGGGVLLFSGFILYDTSNILRNYDLQDYTAATLALYLDILNLFLFLLRLLSGSRS